MSKIRRVSWIETMVVDKDKNILMIFVNDRYDFPDELHVGNKVYIKTGIVDEIVKRGIRRKIFVKAL